MAEEESVMQSKIQEAYKSKFDGMQQQKSEDE